MSADPVAAPLLSARGAVWIALTAVLLCWPMVIGGAAYVFADTQSYLTGGLRIWGVLTDLAGQIWPASQADPVPAGDVGAALDVSADGKATVGRSFLYSGFAFALTALGGALSLAIVQGFIVLWVAAALVGPDALRSRTVLLAGMFFMIVFTSLPWFTVYAMPDILAAVPILFGALLMGRFDSLKTWQKVTVTLVAAFAAASHYGHGPLMLGIVGIAVIWRLVTRRIGRGMLLACVIAIAFAPLANLTASTAVLKETSLAPKRLPILLARSLEDGPARWYLQDACPAADLAFCEVFGTDIPSNVGMFLWTKKGIDDITPDQMSRIRAEEFTILARAFRAYPVQQSMSLLGNAALQTVRIGTRNIQAAEPIDDTLQVTVQPSAAPGNRLLARFDRIVIVATWLGALPLLLLAVTGRLTSGQLQILVLTLAGLVLNAAIFGGLSAPVPRYQSRVIWLLPLLSVLFLAERAASRTPSAGR